MTCGICKLPVALSPSASDRASRYGGKPSDYTALFPNHAECELSERVRPAAAIPVKDLPVAFQEAEMLRLRQRASKAFGCEASSEITAHTVNNMDEAALRNLI